MTPQSLEWVFEAMWILGLIIAAVGSAYIIYATGYVCIQERFERHNLKRRNAFYDWFKFAPSTQIKPQHRMKVQLTLCHLAEEISSKRREYSLSVASTNGASLQKLHLNSLQDLEKGFREATGLAVAFGYITADQTTVEHYLQRDIVPDEPTSLLILKELSVHIN